MNTKLLSKCLLSACLTIALTSTATSCGGNNGGNNGSNSTPITDSSGNVLKDEEISIWWPSGKALQKIMNNAISEYTTLHPNIKVKVVKKAGLDVYDAYKLALNDNKARPDIAILDHVYVQALAHDNQLADLSELGSDVDTKDIFPSSVYSANVYNNKNYGLPLSANTVILMYNKDILKEAGYVDANGEAKAPKTYTELLEACEMVKTNTDYTPFAQPINNSFAAMEFASYVGRVGGNIVSSDSKQVLLDSKEVREAVDDWVSLSKYASQNEYEEGKFYTGKIAFIEMGSWNISKVSGSTSIFNCGFTEMVSMKENVENYSGLGLYSFVVAKKSSHTQAAYEFAKYLSTNKEFQMAFAQEKNLLPVTNESLNDPYYTNDEILNVFSSQLKKVTPRPATPAWPTLEQQIVNMLFNCVSNPTTDGIDSAISSAQKKSQEATDRKFN